MGWLRFKMERWLIYTLAGIGAFIISLFFEEVREFYQEQLETVWEGIEYLLTFQWFGDLWDFISSAFEDIGELSMYGLTFGVLAFVLIFFLRGQMITPFVKYYSPIGKTFWTIATYVTVFVGGYFLGKAFENS